jgi:glycine cleavage system aminomethyltransferase T
MSPTLNRPICLARVDRGVPGDAALAAIVREQPRPVRRVPLPFVPKRYKR